MTRLGPAPMPVKATLASQPVTPILDNFNRADQNPPSNWAQYAGVSGLGIISNRLAPLASGTQGAYFIQQWPTGDVEVYITISIFPSGQGTTGIYTRNDISGGGTLGNGYGWRFQFIAAGTDQFTLVRSDAGTQTTIAGPISQDLTVGDAFMLRSVGQTHTGWARISGVWTLLATVYDATYPGTGSDNRFGVAHAEIATTLARWDDFGGGPVYDRYIPPQRVISR